jgi:hypothetical protein
MIRTAFEQGEELSVAKLRRLLSSALQILLRDFASGSSSGSMPAPNATGQANIIAGSPADRFRG